MSSFSGKKESKSNSKKPEQSHKINFNDEDDLKEVLSTISKKNKSNGNGNIAEKVISFFASHVALTAIIAVYLIICGIAGNIYAVYNLIF